MTAPGTNSLLVLAPHAAVAQYIAGGLTTANGMPNAYELAALIALRLEDRYQWGLDIAAEFDKQLAFAAEGTSALTATVDDIGGPLPGAPGIRPEAQAYLIEVSQGYPYVGTWHWGLTTGCLPIVPKIVSVTPPSTAPTLPDGTTTVTPPIPATATVQVGHSFFQHVGADIHEAITKAVAWIEAEAKKL